MSGYFIINNNILGLNAIRSVLLCGVCFLHGTSVTDAVPQPRWLSRSTRTEYTSIYPSPGLSSSLVMSFSNQTRGEFPFIPRPLVRNHRKRQSTRSWSGPRFNANEYPLKPVFSWSHSPCYCNYPLLD
jgi:hypothetical protein